MRSIDVAAHAGTAFDGQHLFQIAEDRIQKIDPKTGRVLATIPAPGGGGDFGARLGRRDALGRAASGPQDPSDRSGNGGDPSHHRVQPRSSPASPGSTASSGMAPGKVTRATCGESIRNGRGPGAARDAGRNRRVGAGVRWRRPVLLRRRKQRQGASRSPTQTRVHGPQRLQELRRPNEDVNRTPPQALLEDPAQRPLHSKEAVFCVFP